MAPENKLSKPLLGTEDRDSLSDRGPVQDEIDDDE